MTVMMVGDAADQLALKAEGSPEAIETLRAAIDRARQNENDQRRAVRRTVPVGVDAAGNPVFASVAFPKPGNELWQETGKVARVRVITRKCMINGIYYEGEVADCDLGQAEWMAARDLVEIESVDGHSYKGAEEAPAAQPRRRGRPPKVRT